MCTVLPTDAACFSKRGTPFLFAAESKILSPLVRLRQCKAARQPSAAPDSNATSSGLQWSSAASAAWYVYDDVTAEGNRRKHICWYQQDATERLRLREERQTETEVVHTRRIPPEFEFKCACRTACPHARVQLNSTYRCKRLLVLAVLLHPRNVRQARPRLQSV